MMDDGVFKEQYYQLKHDQDALLKQKEQLELAFHEATDSHDAQQSRIAELERQLRETQELAQIRAEEAAAAVELNSELEVARTELKKTKDIVLHKETELTQAKEELSFQSQLVEEERAQAEEFERRLAIEAEWASVNASEGIEETSDCVVTENTDMHFDAIDPAIFQQQQDEINRLMDLLDEEAERRAQLENELMEKRRNGSESLNDSFSADDSLMAHFSTIVDDDDNDELPDLPLDAELELATTLREFPEPPAPVSVDPQESVATAALASVSNSAGGDNAVEDVIHVPSPVIDSHDAEASRETAPFVGHAQVGAVTLPTPTTQAAASQSDTCSPFSDSAMQMAVKPQDKHEAEKHVYENVTAPAKPAIKLSLKQRQQEILRIKRAKQEAKLRQEQLEQQKKEAIRRKQQRQAELRARQKAEHDRMLAEQERAARMRQNRDLEKQRKILLQRQAYLKAQRAAYEEAQRRRLQQQEDAKRAAEAAAAAAAQSPRRLSDGGFKVVLPSQEKVFQAIMQDDVQGAAKRIGLGSTFDGRISLKCTPTGIHLIPTVKRSHKSSNLGKAWEWRLHEVREIEYENKLLNLDIWMANGKDSEQFCFKLTDKKASGLEVFKIIKGFIDTETERQDASMARDMQKVELSKSGKLPHIDRQFMAELRINKEFLELMAKETCTPIRDLQKDDEVFRRNFDKLGPKSNKKLLSLKNKSTRQSFFRGGDRRSSRRTSSSSASSPASVARVPRSPRGARADGSTANFYVNDPPDDDDSASMPLHRQFRDSSPEQPKRRMAWQ
eukprot:m.905179 g.905179  ORF g.905179 m.905179 type:complete len:787 (+) comp23696_c0_seq2:700-3060(+)